MADISTEQLRKELEAAQKVAAQFAATWAIIVKDISASGVEMKKALSSLDLKNSKDIAKLNELSKQATTLAKQQTTATKEQLAIEKQKIQLDKELIKIKSEEERLSQTQIRTKILLTKEEERQAKAKERQARETNKLNSAYAIESKRLNDLIRQYKDLIVSEGKATKETNRLLKEITTLDTKLKSVDKSVGQGGRTVGLYTTAFDKAKGAMASFAGALGITAGIAGLVRGLTNAINIAKDFEQGNANLAAVLGKTSKDVVNLTDDAKRLGAATSFSASQVSQLQTEFAKLGFNEKEILNATEATLDLAAATGSDLAESAAIAGATLGGFGLDAAETGRVTDVMAKSFSTSALDMEKFKESMKDAAPAAKAVGVDVEKTTALLGSLANAGISGSKAGSALKAGFIELNDAGITLDESLQMISNSNDKLATATELVGKRAATSFLVLADGVEVTNELELGLRNAGGAAKKMADEQLDTLTGKTKILSSAWEGFVLSLLSGDSAFNSVSKSIVEMTTSLLGALTPSEELATSWFSQRDAVNSLESSLNPLIDRYDTLTSQSELTKDEQVELDNIIVQISENVPSAVTEFDKYGKALDISTSSAKAFIQQQKDLLALDNEEAIKEQEEELTKLDRRLTRLNQTYKVQDGVLQTYSRELEKATNGKHSYLEATDEEIQKFSESGEAIRNEIELREAKIQKLKGEKTDLELLSEQEGVNTELLDDNTQSLKDNNNESGKRTDNLLKLKEQLEDVNNQLILDEDTRAIEQIKTSFDRKIAAIKGNSQVEKDLRIALAKQRAKEIAEAALKRDDSIGSLESKTLEEQDDELLIKKKSNQKEYTDVVLNDLENIADKEAENAAKRQEILDASIKALDKLFADSYAKKEGLIDKDLEKSKDAQSKIQAGIEAGNEDAKKSLAEEDRNQIELEKKKEATKKKAQRAEAAIALLQSYGQNGGDLGKTLGDYNAIISAIQAVPAFIEGTEKVSDGVNGATKIHNGEDGYLARFDGRERILNPSQNDAIGSITNSALVDVVTSYKRGLITDSSLAMNVVSVDNGSLILAVNKMQSSLDNLHKQIPVSNYNYDAKNREHIQTIEYHNRVEKIRTKAKKSWA